MSKITKEQVHNIAKLARLEITDEEAEKYSHEVGSMIELAEQLNEVDTTNVEPTTHISSVKNVMRKDEPKEWITRDDALKNAPDHKDGLFRVPSILD